MPYVFLLFCCYPLVVFIDFFREADILFDKKGQNKTEAGSSRAGKGGENPEERDSHMDEDMEKDLVENPFFAFFRRNMHTPNFRLANYLNIQVVYLTTLLLMMWNPLNKDTENLKGCKEVHLFHYIVLVVTAILVLEETVDFVLNIRMKEKANFFESQWNFWIIVSRFILLVGLSVFLCSCHRLEEIESANEAFLSGNRNRAFLSGNHRLNWSSTLICLGWWLVNFSRLFVSCSCSMFMDPWSSVWSML